MDNIELDQLLSSAATPLPAAAENEARRVADATMPARLRRGHAPRPRWFVPVVIGGALALTAGAGTATIAMSHWGGVSMPIENVRNSTPIPVTWETDTGHVEECRVWIEIRNPEPGDGEALDGAIARSDWRGLGQRLYNDAAPPANDSEGEQRVGDGLTPVVQDFVAATFPGVAWFGEGASRGVDAWGMTCVPEAK